MQIQELENANVVDIQSLKAQYEALKANEIEQKVCELQEQK